ncbi:Hypothetical protein A7982_01367 [Minicystis rosea]|nr:Hypothetical protein A7982_01367 [Minicystis rosea]
MTRAALALSLCSLPVMVYAGCAGTDLALGNMPDDTIHVDGGVDCTNGPDFTDCPCNPGEAKACYTGPASTRGVGACKDGVQTCTEQQEFRYAFGPCTGETLPSEENGQCVAVDGGPIDGCAPDECDPALPAPRPIGPTSTGRVSSWRPTLRWQLADGTDGARVTLCHDRACASIITTLDAPGTSVKLATDLPPGVVYWKLSGRSGGKHGTTTSPVWQFVVGHKSAPVDTSWGTSFDVNGDGFADIIASVRSEGIPPSFPKGQGRLYVYHGGPDGIPEKPTATVAAPADASYFGWVATSAGDVNGDGYADAIVGTNGGLPGCSGGSAGYSPDEVWIYFGGPNGLAATPAVTLKGPQAGVGTCGATCPSQSCSSLNPACMADCDYFGSWVSPGGDINGDGYADVLVGAGRGNAAYVYYGSATGVDPTATKLTGTNSFGGNISGIGDVNGDGYADIAVANGSSIVLFMGSAAGLVTTPIALLPGSKGPAAWWGSSMTRGVDCAGDVNGDGYADVVTTTNGGSTNDATGMPGYVYYGGPDGVTAAPAVVWSGGGSSSSALVKTSGGGDLNGDGYSDVLWAGTDYVTEHLGAAGGISASFAEQVPWTYVNTVLGAGDLNGDGFDDAVVARNPSSTGTIMVYYGTATGVTATNQVLSPPVGDSFDTRFGYVLGGSSGL